MIEREFLDRVPTNPGRVKLTHVSGNEYDMERADSPVVAGTPLDKATFDSIVHSRLTGRLYTPTVERAVLRSAVVTSNPIPASGWVAGSTTELTNGSYRATASGAENQHPVEHAFDSSASTYWADVDEETGKTWIAVDFGSRIVVNKLRVNWFSYDYDSFSVVFQGSNNGTAWTNIASRTGNTDGAEVWEFSNATEYSQYRLQFTQGTENTMRLYEWAIAEWSATVYKNLFTVSKGFPSEWTENQLALVQAPNGINTVGVQANTLNGVTVNTILQPNKRYELRYTGSAFAAKEV